MCESLENVGFVGAQQVLHVFIIFDISNIRKYNYLILRFTPKRSAIPASYSETRSATMPNGTERDQARLRHLNEQYIDAVMQANVNWYQQHLAEDFVCIDSEGTVFDKPAFLEH